MAAGCLPPFCLSLPETIIIGVLWSVLAAGAGMAITNLYARLRDMSKEIADLHLIYAKKEDVRNDFEIIRQMLQRIEDKLDNKVDR